MKAVILILATGCFLAAQPPGGRGGPPAEARSAKAAAVFDPTGYWVSYVTEEWRQRMLPPRKAGPAAGPPGFPGAAFGGMPLTPEAQKIAEAWDPARDEAAGEQCKAYGAPNIMRVPSRLHITWQDDNTLKMDVDAGQQTRLFHFQEAKSGGERTWQGSSAAAWQDGALQVVTTNLRPGYLRNNGIPYSNAAFVNEYFNLVPLPGGEQLLMDIIVVQDPKYLTDRVVTSVQFKKEADGTKWDPEPCKAR